MNISGSDALNFIQDLHGFILFPLNGLLDVRLQAGRVAAGRKPAELVANILCGFEAAHEVQHAGNKQFAGFVAQALIPHVPHGHTASSLAWTGS